MPEWALSFWQWLQTASQGQASFVGTLMGSFLGLVALLLGALFNAHLNRCRDDRLRNEDRSAVALLWCRVCFLSWFRSSGFLNPLQLAW